MKTVMTIFLFLATASAHAENTLNILRATYGGNIGAAKGNLTSAAQKFCNEKKYCKYNIETQYVDPKGVLPANRAKDFSVEFSCSDAPATVYQIDVPNNATGSILRLSCESDADVEARLGGGNPAPAGYSPSEPAAPTVVAPVVAAPPVTAPSLSGEKEITAAVAVKGVVIIKYGNASSAASRMYDRDFASIKAKFPEATFYSVVADPETGAYGMVGKTLPQIHIYVDGALKEDHIIKEYKNIPTLAAAIKKAI